MWGTLGISGHRVFVDFHQKRVVLLGGVIRFILEACGTPHCDEFLRMIPSPFHLARKVLRVARIEMQACSGVRDNFLHSSQTRTEHWNTTGKCFDNHHGKALIPKAWCDLESRTFDCGD